MSRARPSIKEIHEQLKDLVDWETFAIHLPKITPTEVKTIKKDFPLDNNRQKQALFDRWLHVYPNASWDAIILALENVDEDTIANNIRLYRKHIVSHILYLHVSCIFCCVKECLSCSSAQILRCV